MRRTTDSSTGNQPPTSNRAQTDHNASRVTGHFKRSLAVVAVALAAGFIMAGAHKSATASASSNQKSTAANYPCAAQTQQVAAADNTSVVAGNNQKAAKNTTGQIAANAECANASNQQVAQTNDAKIASSGCNCGACGNSANAKEANSSA